VLRRFAPLWLIALYVVAIASRPGSRTAPTAAQINNYMDDQMRTVTSSAIHLGRRPAGRDP
jgi:hypothetical protein